MRFDADAGGPKSGPGLKKRILVVAALFPPNVIGGAEISAFNIATWLAEQGHDVSVVTCAKSRDQVCEAKDEHGLKVWRVLMPRPYAMFDFPRASRWLKPLWHLQDHFDPRNRSILRRVLDATRPDIVNIHILQGLGYNVLHDLAGRDVEVFYFLHDLGLACVRMSMFKAGRNCSSQCTMCRVSSTYKASLIRGLRRVNFVSPSQANLDKLAAYFPLREYRRGKILNPNNYPRATERRVESKTLRILYVGRIHRTKGVHVLLEAVARLAERYDVELTLVGDGPDRLTLKATYSRCSWCVFTGFIPQTAISNYMINSDVLCIPSLWAENSPGVAIHALQLGVPVIGSDSGGIPELIEPGKNGALVEPGNVDAWAAELERLLKDPRILADWRAYALETAWRYERKHLGRLLEQFMFGASSGVSV